MSGNGASPTISEVLNDTFGFPEFRPGQEEVIDTIMGGGNVLAVMPTGSGKSLCYQVPAIALPGVTVVVSPLVALMQDQVSALKLAGVAAETINSSRDRGTNIETWRSVSDGTTKLLYLSPERLMTEQMLTALSALPLSPHRGRRSPLHFAMGPGLPAGICRPDPAQGALSGDARRRLHRNRRRGHPRGHCRQAVRRQGAHVRRRVRPPQHLPGGRDEARLEAAAQGLPRRP